MELSLGLEDTILDGVVREAGLKPQRQGGVVCDDLSGEHKRGPRSGPPWDRKEAGVAGGGYWEGKAVQTSSSPSTVVCLSGRQQVEALSGPLCQFLLSATRTLIKCVSSTRLGWAVEKQEEDGYMLSFLLSLSLFSFFRFILVQL